MGWSALSPARPAGQARTRLARGGYSFSNTLVGFRSKQSVKRDLCGASGKKRFWNPRGVMPVCAVSL